MTSTQPGQIDVALAEVADAVVAAGSRTAALIESIEHPTRPAIGVWSALETAVHVTHAVEMDRAVATGEVAGPLRDRLRNVTLATLDELTQRMVNEEPERDRAALAARVRTGCGELSARLRAAGDDVVVPWLGPIELPLSAVGAHVVEEMLVHGFDIARSQRVRWPLDPAHLRLAVAKFVVPMMSAVDANEFVDRERAKGFTAVFEMRIRGVTRRYFVFDDGRLRIEHDRNGPVDAILSADPGSFLLVQLGRSGRIRPAVTGRMLVWGRRPWRFARFVQVMQSV